MRKRIFRIAATLLVGGLGLPWGLDYGSVKYGIARNRQMFDVVRVDQLYTVPNKWHEIEWSRGDPVMERCVNSLFPHFGCRPCWYVRRHTMHVNELG